MAYRRPQRPICPNCGKPSIITDERFGGKYECPDCQLWAWGGKPLKSREENKAARERGLKREIVNLDLGDDRPEWADVIGCKYPITIADLTQAYRDKAKTLHPDHGGSVDAMVELNLAYKRAQQSIEGMKLGDPKQEMDLGNDTL